MLCERVGMPIGAVPATTDTERPPASRRVAFVLVAKSMSVEVDASTSSVCAPFSSTWTVTDPINDRNDWLASARINSSFNASRSDATFCSYRLISAGWGTTAGPCTDPASSCRSKRSFSASRSASIVLRVGLTIPPRKCTAILGFAQLPSSTRRSATWLKCKKAAEKSGHRIGGLIKASRRLPVSILGRGRGYQGSTMGDYFLLIFVDPLQRS